MTDTDATLDGYAAAFYASRERVHALADGLTDVQFNWKPGPAAWSVGECLVHLGIIAEAYGPFFDEALQAAPPRPARPAPFRNGLLGGLFVRAMRPGARRMKTFGPMRPPPSDGARSALGKTAVLADFDRYTDALLGAVERSRAVDAGRVRVREPYFPMVRLPLVAFLDGLGQHALRHVGQAERVVAAMPEAQSHVDDSA